MRVRPTQALRDRTRRRTRTLEVALHPEEYEAIFKAARYTDEFTASWARDVLVSRALHLERKRTLSD